MYRAGCFVAALTVIACGAKDPDPGPAAAPGSGSARPPRAPLPLGRVPDGPAYVTPPTPPREQLDKIGAAAVGAEDLLAISAGAIVVSAPPPDARKGSPWLLLDEDAASGYAQLGAATGLTPIVIALSDEVEIERASIDDARDALADHIPARVRLEGSPDGAAWSPILDAPIDLPSADGVGLLAPKPARARFVRLTLLGTHDTQVKDGVQELQEVRVFGKRVTHDAPPSATGTYQIDGVGRVSLTQTGATVTGCVEHRATRIAGGFDGRVLRFALTEASAADSGPVVMTFGAGRAFWGMWPGGVEAHALMTASDGARTSEAASPCPGDAKADPIAADLAATGRARLYGVVFDLESEALRDDAKPTLDRLVALMKAQPALAIRIEAHTDGAATPPHNQILSAKQAVSIRQYLVAGGVAPTRIAMKAMGATQPIAQDSTPLGRAQNRRIEIVKTN